MKIFFDVFDKFFHKETSVAVDIYDDVILLGFSFIFFPIIYCEIARIHKKFHIFNSVMSQIFQLMEISRENFYGSTEDKFEEEFVGRLLRNLDSSHDIKFSFGQECWPERGQPVGICMR